jgi:hypothetical protein
MPRPKNYAFEKAQRERARVAKKAARKEANQAAKARGEDPDALPADPSDDAAKGEDPGPK